MVSYETQLFLLGVGQEEILFLGPDEGTADLMDWAATYAKTRGYAQWSSLTTGKSPALGGIPHDTFGMTTQSVHTYVVGILRELGIPEETITKFQTGGPDGDLGSNEILVSKDKTKAVVDGRYHFTAFLIFKVEFYLMIWDWTGES